MRTLDLLFAVYLISPPHLPDATTSPIRLSLALEPSETIPCVPVTFRVTTTNTAKQSARLPSVVILEVTPETGETFVPGFLDGVRLPIEQTTEEFPHDVELRAREERSFDFIASPAWPPWFGDRGFVQPGTYRLQLLAEWRPQFDASPSADPVRSNQAVLTIAEPTGSDLGAWRLFKDAVDPCTAMHEHSTELWGQYPDSIYTGMTSPPGPRGDIHAQLQALEIGLIKKQPPGYADALKLDIADIHLRLMHRALGEQNVQLAFEHSEAARALLEELAGKETGFGIKQEAKRKLLDSVLTRVDLQDAIDRFRGLASDDCERVGFVSMREEIASYSAGSAAPAKRDRLKNVVESLDEYEKQLNKSPADTDGALHALEKAAGELEKLLDEEGLTGEYVGKWALFVAGGSEYSVRKSVELAAQDPAVDPKKLEQAQKALEAGRAAQEKKEYRKAVSWYRDALKKAEQASKARRVPC